jgi:hypothetical protein
MSTSFKEDSRRPDAAIEHILMRIHTDPAVGYYCGPLTETFDRLTAAFAAICGEDLEKVRARFEPIGPTGPGEVRNPRRDIYKGWMPGPTEIADVIDEMATPDRMELIQSLLDRFCVRCGGVCLVRPCGCHLSYSHEKRTEEAQP